MKLRTLRHKAYLCAGEMEWVKLPTRFGGVTSGWRCSACGKALYTGVHSLQHTPLKPLQVVGV